MFVHVFIQCIFSEIYAKLWGGADDRRVIHVVLGLNAGWLFRQNKGHC